MLTPTARTKNILYWPQLSWICKGLEKYYSIVLQWNSDHYLDTSKIAAHKSTQIKINLKLKIRIVRHNIITDPYYHVVRKNMNIHHGHVKWVCILIYWYIALYELVNYFWNIIMVYTCQSPRWKHSIEPWWLINTHTLGCSKFATSPPLSRK